jgi:hypothetical protein
MSTKSSLLPCKKRKTSHDSSSISAVTSSATSAAAAGLKEAKHQATGVVAATMTMTVTTTTTPAVSSNQRPRQESATSQGGTTTSKSNNSNANSNANSNSTNTAADFLLAQSLVFRRGRNYSPGDCCSLPVDDLPDCASIVLNNHHHNNRKPAAATSKTSTSTSASAAKPAGASPSAAAAADLGEVSSHDETFASSGHRLLMEAIMMKTVADATSASAAAEAQRQSPNTGTGTGTGGIILPTTNAGFRDRLDSIHSFVQHRNRLESWGGMSELSFTGLNINLSTNTNSNNSADENTLAGATITVLVVDRIARPGTARFLGVRGSHEQQW